MAESDVSASDAEVGNSIAEQDKWFIDLRLPDSKAPALPPDLAKPPSDSKHENSVFHPALRRALKMLDVDRAELDCKAAGTLKHTFDLAVLSRSGPHGMKPDFTRFAPGCTMAKFGLVGFLEVECGAPDKRLSSDHRGQVHRYNVRLLHLQPGRRRVISALTNLHVVEFISTERLDSGLFESVQTSSFPLAGNGWRYLHDWVHAPADFLGYPWLQLPRSVNGRDLQISECLGTGRTASVWRGVLGEREVAVKLVREPADAQREIQVLQAMAKAAAADDIDLPATLPRLLYTHRTDSGVTCLVMSPVCSPMIGT